MYKGEIRWWWRGRRGGERREITVIAVGSPVNSRSSDIIAGDWERRERERLSGEGGERR